MALVGEFAGRVDAHLVADARHGRGMVQQIGRALAEDHVASGMHVRTDMKQHFLVVVHVDMLIDHDDDLAEHHLAQAPNGGHHFARLLRVTLADGDKGKIVEDAEPGQIVVDDLGYK